MSSYIGDSAALVKGPIGKNKDGSWSKREVVLASFRNPLEATSYAAQKALLGVPVKVKYPPDANFPKLVSW